MPACRASEKFADRVWNPPPIRTRFGPGLPFRRVHFRNMCKKPYTCTHIFQNRILRRINAKRSVLPGPKETLMYAFGKQNSRVLDRVARSGGKEPSFWGLERRTLTSDIDVNFTIHSGPPVHAIPPGVFDQTGGDLHQNWAHFGLCLGILGKQGPLRARIGEVVWCFEKGFWGGRIRRGRGENFVLKGSCEFLFQDPPEIFPAKSAQKFSIKV
jgi:hypothetical protein